MQSPSAHLWLPPVLWIGVSSPAAGLDPPCCWGYGHHGTGATDGMRERFRPLRSEQLHSNGSRGPAFWRPRARRTLRAPPLWRRPKPPLPPAREKGQVAYPHTWPAEPVSVGEQPCRQPTGIPA